MSAPTGALNRRRGHVECIDPQLYLVPLSFAINGTSNPLVANNLGDEIVSLQVVRNAAGKFTISYYNSAAVLLGAYASISVTADSTDMAAQVGPVDTVTNKNIVIRTMVGAVMTDPATTTVVSGFLICKSTKRRASK